MVWAHGTGYDGALHIIVVNNGNGTVTIDGNFEEHFVARHADRSGKLGPASRQNVN